MRPLNPGKVVQWLFSSRSGPPSRLVPRWIFLRALAAIYFSAFYSLLFPDQGFDRSGRHSARAGISYSRRAELRPVALLVRTFALLVLLEFLGTHDDHASDRADRVGHCVPQSMAASQFLCLFCLLPLVCQRLQRFLRLSIGRHAARGRFHCALLRAARPASRMGRGLSAFARQPVLAAMGVVPHLL